MRKTAWLGVLIAVGLGLEGGLSAVEAACASSRAIRSGSSSFGTPGQPFTPNADFPYRPYGGTTTYYLRGSFWSFGSGNPAHGAGTDNGSLPGRSPAVVSGSWLGGGYFGGLATYLGGESADWQTPGVDGCITDDGSDPDAADPDECMVVLLNDLIPSTSYFAVLSTPPDANGDFTFSQATGFPSQITLARVPYPSILSARGFSLPAAIELTLTVDPGPLAFGVNGFYLQCHADEIPVGYKLYVRNPPFGTWAPQVIDNRSRERFDFMPASPHLDPWVELTPEAIPIGDPVTLEVPCPYGGFFHVAASLVFGGVEQGAEPYELDFLSMNSSLVDCTVGDGLISGMGRIPPTIAVNKSALVPGDLTIGWQPSCSEKVADYGIYEGQIGQWYSHSQIDCSDDDGDLIEEVAASEGDRYYLVVPNASASGCCEGSYGLDSGDYQRPRGLSVCNETLFYGVCSAP